LLNLDLAVSTRSRRRPSLYYSLFKYEKCEE
jgi:hypothetical protein